MRCLPSLMALVLGAFATLAWGDAADEAKAPEGFGSKGYVWNKMTREQVDILKLPGDFARGKEAFRACRGCHKSDGSGLPDGTYPRLTGQHAIVTIKQVTDTRAGLRVNPKMAPFASQHAISLQDIADIAVYLAYVQTNTASGKGPGTHVARGKQVYEANRCQRCHGSQGEGDEAKVYPVVAAQHYAYALREMQHVKEGSRSNAHPEMAKALAKISVGDMEAVADYLSRLPDYRQAAK